MSDAHATAEGIEILEALLAKRHAQIDQLEEEVSRLRDDAASSRSKRITELAMDIFASGHGKTLLRNLRAPARAAFDAFYDLMLAMTPDSTQEPAITAEPPAAPAS